MIINRYYFFLMLSIFLIDCSNDSIVKKKDYLEIIRKDYESFSLESHKETIIILKNGSKFIIPANIFESGDSINMEVSDSIEFRLREYLTVSDLILGNLYTISDSNPLETFGMFYIEVFDKNQKLKLIKDKSILYVESQKRNISGAQVFYGDTINNLINWNLEFKNYPKPVDSNEEYLETVPIDTFNFSKLGWINLDMFKYYNYTDLKIYTDFSLTDYHFSIVIKDFRTILRGYHDSKNELIFSKIPLKKEVFLIGIKKEKGKYLYIKKTFMTNPVDKIAIPKAEPVAQEMLIDELKLLDKLWD